MLDLPTIVTAGNIWNLAKEEWMKMFPLKMIQQQRTTVVLHGHGVCKSKDIVLVDPNVHTSVLAQLYLRQPKRSRPRHEVQVLVARDVARRREKLAACSSDAEREWLKAKIKRDNWEQGNRRR